MQMWKVKEVYPIPSHAYSENDQVTSKLKRRRKGDILVCGCYLTFHVIVKLALQQ